MRKILAALAFLTLGLAQELVVLTHSSFSLGNRHAIVPSSTASVSGPA